MSPVDDPDRCRYCRDTESLAANDLAKAKAAHRRDLAFLKANAEMLRDMIAHDARFTLRQAEIVLDTIDRQYAAV